MAFKASPSSQHQHCTDEAQKAETVLSAVTAITNCRQYFFFQTNLYLQIENLLFTNSLGKLLIYSDVA